jgi:hypothetical protein
MSEFKFACPVCGQHMAADSGSSGLQIECPTCFQPILVPRPPAAESKYVLSATQPIKPHLPSTAAPPPAAAPRRSAVALAAYAAVCIGLLAAGVFGYRIWMAGHKEMELQDTAAPEWTLRLEKRSFPDRAARGAIRGRPFVCERAVLQGGLLTLRQRMAGGPDVAVTIALFARQAEDLEGKSFNIGTNDTGAPNVVLRWNSEQGQRMTQTFVDGYALKLEFGKPTATGMPAKIYLCLPDEKRSRVAGSFNAEIRRPGAPRPRSPDRRS